MKTSRNLTKPEWKKENESMYFSPILAFQVAEMQHIFLLNENKPPQINGANSPSKRTIR